MWWNGRHRGLKIPCHFLACGFESRHQHQLSPHVLIQSMRTSFCIYRMINRQNTGYNYQIWAVDARNGLLCVILSDDGFRSTALFSPHIPTFRGRNQRFIMECTLLWTIAGYRPQCEVSSKVSRNSVKCTLKMDNERTGSPNSGHIKVQLNRLGRPTLQDSCFCSSIH